MKWNYHLKQGRELREAINEDKMEEVLNLLWSCYVEINQNLPDLYDEDELQEDLADIDNQLDNLENYEDYGMSEDDVMDEINYLLNNFYDFCDNLKIWIGL